MKTANKIRIILAGLIVLLIVSPFFVPLIKDFMQYKEYESKNIYPAEFGHYDNQFKSLRITYMICKPEKSESALKAQIDQYLEDNEIVRTLLEEYKEKGKIIRLMIKFIKPTDYWPVGKIGKEQDEALPFDGEMRLCEIVIDCSDLDSLQYEFFPENLT